MPDPINGKCIAIVVADSFEQVEMTKPKQALEEAGAKTEIVSSTDREVQGWKHFEKGDRFPADVPLDSANPKNYDALLLPGGVANPDQLRANPKAMAFAKSFFEEGKPICHGPWLKVEADVVRGRKVTTWTSVQTDLKDAGATWVDQEVVAEQGLVTSRKPDDIPTFNRKMVEEFREVAHSLDGVGRVERR
jgi:protease I